MRRFVPPGGIEETIALCVRRVFGKNGFAKMLQIFWTKHHKDEAEFERELLQIVHASKDAIWFAMLLIGFPRAYPIDSIYSRCRLKSATTKNTVAWSLESFNEFVHAKNTWNRKTKTWTFPKKDFAYFFRPTTPTKQRLWTQYKIHRRLVALRGPITQKDNVLLWAIDNKIIPKFTANECNAFEIK